MIEIRELIIRATVDNTEGGSTKSAAIEGEQAAGSQGLREATEQLVAMLKEKNER